MADIPAQHFVNSGDPSGQSRALQGLAALILRRGDPAKARALLDKALGWSKAAWARCS